MTVSLAWFSDSGLTTAFPGPIQTSHNSDGSTGDVDGALYLGSTSSSKKFEATSDPGTDQITVTIADSAVSSGHEKAEVKLATTVGGLDSAVAGDPLNLGTQLLSEAGNSQPIHYRINAAYLTVGVSTELSLTINSVDESAV